MYSIGSNGLYQFEDDLHKIAPHCEIHTFDFGRFARPNDYLKYHQYGLKSSYYPSYRVPGASKTFQEILKELGHENRTIDLFKIDCEGCEWVTFEDWITHDIRQVQIEVHGLPGTSVGGYMPVNRQQPVSPTALYERFTKEHFALFEKELNPYNTNCYELAYIKMAPEFWETTG